MNLKSHFEASSPAELIDILGGAARPTHRPMFEELRKGLFESYKPRPATDVTCICCGKGTGNFAFHVIEYSHADAIAPPSILVPMSGSRGFIRGSAVLCDACISTCSTCGLPIASLWIDKMVAALCERFPDVTFRRGNGRCHDHVHPLIDLKAFWRKPRIADAPRPARRTPTLAAPQNQRAPQSLQPNGPSRSVVASPASAMNRDARDLLGLLRDPLDAASKRLQSMGRDSIRWLRNELTQPFIEHLSFTRGNQLFFVQLDLPHPVLSESDKQLMIRLAKIADGVPCVMPMHQTDRGPQPAMASWGLVHAATGQTIDVEREAARSPVEWTDWELQDFAVQIVCEHIRKSGGKVTRRNAYPGYDPSVWYEDQGGGAWVVVRSARYPSMTIPRPDNLAAIRADCSRSVSRGYYASVAVANCDQWSAEDESPLPLIRGGGVHARFTGLESLS